MTDQNKFEEMLERLINEDRSGAEELFHEIVVAKSREIYQDIIESEEEVDERKRLKFWVEFHERLIYPLLPILFSLISLASVLKGSFNRKGNNSNIITAVIMNVAFFASLMASFGLIEKSKNLTAIPYIVIFIFVVTSVTLLTSNYRKKTK